MSLQPSAKYIVLGLCCVLPPPLLADSIDFEGLPAGTIVEELSAGAGITGTTEKHVRVFGSNPTLDNGNTNAAVVFDSANPPNILRFLDLGTPHQDFGGPGVGAGGQAGMPFQNDTAHGNVLVINNQLEDADGDGLVDLPDDDDVLGMLTDFEFFHPMKNGQKFNQVTFNSVTYMDVEREEGEDGAFILLERVGGPTSLIQLPPTGNNGVNTIDGIGLDGVTDMRFTFNGSSALVAVIFDEPQERPCWITTGGFHNAGIQSGSKDFTFGGNVGPPPSGAWQVIDHNTDDNFHTNDVRITDCVVIDKTGPEQPGGKKGFEINQAFFEGTGRLNGLDGFPFTGYVIDAGEPSGKNGNDKDQFSITVTHPDTGLVVFEATGELDGGNVQIHPPVGPSFDNDG